MREAQIVVAGAGGLGAPSLLEFVRAGTREVRVIEPDFVDPGNVVRWPLGFRAAGWPKGDVLKAFASAEWPYSDVRWFDLRLGAPRYEGGKKSQAELLSEVLSGVDLVYDTTAEPGAWHALSDAAREAGIPYVVVWTTPGAWGGVAARIAPSQEGPCWMCLRILMDEGVIPAPVGDPQGTVQPVGCADPTFTGNGFDVTTIALLGVRLVVATLCGGRDGSYPNPPWDVAVLNLRTETGALTPSIYTAPIARHEECPADHNH